MGDRDVVSVVIADDDAVMRSALVELMEGQPAIELAGLATTADEALALVKEKAPDVLLLDLRMPGGGKDAAQSVKEVAPDTRIVVLTAEDDQAARRVMAGVGVDSYLVKGVPGGEILDAILGR